MHKIAVVFLFFLSNEAISDEYFRFLNINCVEEIGFFEAIGTGISNIGAYNKSSSSTKIVEAETNLILGEGEVKTSCRVDQSLYEVKVDYSSTPGSGRCMGNPGGFLTIKKDGAVIYDELMFDWACDSPEVNRVSIHPGGFIQLCGANYSGVTSVNFCEYGFSIKPKDKALDQTEFSEYIRNKYK